MFGAGFLNEKMCMKTNRLLLNNNKDFIEESLLLTNHRRRGVDFGLPPELVLCSRTAEETLTKVQNKNVTKCCHNICTNSTELFQVGSMWMPLQGREVL